MKEQNDANNNVGGTIVARLIFSIIVFIFSISIFQMFKPSNRSIENGSTAENYALDDIPEIAITFSTVRSNELKCEADSMTDDEIVLVKCTTTNDELIDYYESSTIWYGWQSSADGNTYLRWADKDKSEVLSHIRK